LLCVSTIFSPLIARAAPIPQTIDNANRWRLRGSIHPSARAEFDRGAVDGALAMEGMKLVFQLTPEQRISLDTLLRQQLNPSSPNYHRWLTHEQYADRFGLGPGDVSRVADWLRQRGFTAIIPARSRTLISFNGSAEQVESAFHTQIHHYLVEGTMHYANAIEPTLPSAFRGVVMAIGGLNDFRPKPHSVVRNVYPRFTSDISGKHFLAPDDFATIYDIQGLYSSGINGSLEAIAVMGQTDLSTDSNHNNQYDVQTFRSVSNLPPVDLQVILVPGQSDPGSNNAEQDEANLDLEWSGAVARNAKLIYVNSKNALFTSLQYAVDQDLAPVISISYGLCEAQFSSTEIAALTATLQQANAQGQTVVASSGDSGPADCDYSSDPNSPVKSATHGYAVDVPASFPYVTGMGGTEFSEGDATGATQYWSGTNNNNGSAISYIPEIVWNDTVTDGSLAATGGGVSTLFIKPSWQTGTGVPTDGQRDVPDLALSSSADHDGYLICSRSSCVNGYRKSDQTLTVIGGTSTAAPTFAGVIALLVQQTNNPLGNVNPFLYALAASSPNAFHDITTGDNMVPCTQGTKDCPASGMIGYSAGPGYDLTTGLGSIDVGALAAAWNGPTNPDFRVMAQSASLAIISGTPMTDLLTITGLAGFSSGVNLTCMVSSTLTTTSCSISPDSVTPRGTATLTVTAGSLSVNLRVNPFLHLGWQLASVFVFAAGLFLSRTCCGIPGRRGLSIRNSLLGLFMICVLLGTVSCGGGSGSAVSQQQPSLQPQNGTVTVQASSGNLNHTVQISVTVN